MLKLSISLVTPHVQVQVLSYEEYIHITNIPFDLGKKRLLFELTWNNRIMPAEKILRIDREDQKEGIVYVNVSSNGPLPLDLKLLATDGLDPFVLNRKPI